MGGGIRKLEHEINLTGSSEQNVVIKFPGGEMTIQYRNYEGDKKTGKGASIDICMDKPRTVHNWRGVQMDAAPKGSQGHIRIADQLMFIV